MSREKKTPRSQGRKKRREGHKDSSPPEARESEASETGESGPLDAGEKTKKKIAAGRAAEQKIAELEEQVRDLTERLQRKTAEFANYQKRVRKEMEDTRKYAVGPLALELLSVLDSFDRALGSVESTPPQEGADPSGPAAGGDVLKGLEMIHSQLKAALAGQGIVSIEALNERFDPNRHDAVMEEENPDLPDRTVMDELVKGYMLHDRLLRPARVRVSRAPRKESEKNEEKEGSPGEDPRMESGRDE